MNGINWIKVLEIETFMNKVMNENAIFFQVRIWEEGKKHNLTLNKNRLYQPEDIKEYLFQKYPNNEFFRGAEEFIDQLYVSLIYGNRIGEVDEELYKLNLNPESLQTSNSDQRLKFLEAFNERIGVDIYWYNVLKEVILSQNHYDSEKIIQDFLGVIDNKLRKELGFSIDEFDDSILLKRWKRINEKCPIIIELFTKFEVVKDRILNYKNSSYYSVFQKMCDVNGYDFYYKDSEPNLFLKDSLSFSINLCINRVLNDSDEIFSYELRKSTSLYPQDLMKNPYKTLMVYITPFGFHNFDRVTKLYQTGKLDEAVKECLSEEFETIDKSAIVDNEDWISEWNRFNSSFIVGRDLAYRTFWGRRTKEFVNKLISGIFWFNDDVHGTSLSFIDLHPETAYEGEQQYSMPAKNVLYYYSELRLEKAQWNRELNEIYEAGYRDDVVEEDDEDEDYDEW